jgi:OmcA/MtrC family decaheme c-type cytochrome
MAASKGNRVAERPRNSLIDLNARGQRENKAEISFSGDRRNCTKCHEKGANELPLPEGVLATAIQQADGSVRLLPPIMSACVGCHTKEPAKAHMEQQIASSGKESCVVCHGVAREFSVEKMHRKGRE